MQNEYTQVYKETQEQEWLEARKGGIGASDVPKLLGLVEQCMPFAWYLQKTGQAKPFEGNLMTTLGHDLERTIHGLYEKHTGNRLVDPGDYTIIRSKDHPWLFCTPDRYARPDINVEMKVVFPQIGRTLVEGECLIAHRVQTQIQMYCLGWKKSHVAILNLYGPNFYIVEVDRDDGFIQGVIPVLHDALLALKDGRHPEIDGSENTSRVVRRLHPEDNGETIDLGASWYDKIHELDVLEAEMAEKKEAYDSIRNEACYTMGPNTYAALDGERVFSFKHSKNSRVLRRIK